MSRSWIVTPALLLALCGVAGADEMDAGEVAIPELEQVAPESVGLAETPPADDGSYDGRTAIDAWDDARTYGYGTQLIFPFTRGMADVGVTGWARWPMGVLTVPLDVVFLPGGLVAGIFGD